jgi:hypothetical protein
MTRPDPAPLRLSELRPGDRVRVLRSFVDFDGASWEAGEVHELVDTSYFPYDGGYAFRFAARTLRLAHVHPENDRILRAADLYFARVAGADAG